MVTSPVSDTDDSGMSDAEIQQSLKPFFADIDADYDAAFDDLAKAFSDKGPAEGKDA